ncbi:tetratricopeptide repeat protein, partial [bacterium]|nr:tetratricopeptide repeat protein [bacterium]
MRKNFRSIFYLALAGYLLFFLNLNDSFAQDGDTEMIVEPDTSLVMPEEEATVDSSLADVMAPADEITLSYDETIAPHDAVLTLAFMERWRELSQWQGQSQEVDLLLRHGREILKEAENYYFQVGPGKFQAKQYSDLVVMRMRGVFENIIYKLEIELADNYSIDELQQTLTTYTSKREELQAQVHVKRKEVIENSERYVARYERQGSMMNEGRREMMASVIFRLADLYYLEADEQFADALIEYDIRIADIPPDQPLPPEPKADYSKSLKMYRKIIDEYSSSEFVNDALYNIAIIQGKGDSEFAKRQAKDTFITMVENFPDSRYAAEALFRVGDYYFFSENTPEQAIGYYMQVLDHEDSDQYDDALYMLGWCNYYIGDDENYQKAVDYFDQTILYSHKQQEEGGQSFGNLSDEAIKYSAITFALDPSEWSGSGVENAVTFITADSLRQEVYGHRLMTNLGGILADDYRDDFGAIDAYSNAVDIFPTHPRNPWVYNDIISIYWENLEDEDATYQRREEMFQRHRRGSEWDLANKEDEQLRADADTLMNKYYYQNFLIAANQVNDTKDPESITEALNVTQNYLTEFPISEKTPYIQYTMAALLEDTYKNDPEPQYLVDAFEAYKDVVLRWGENDYRLNAGQRLFAIAQTLIDIETESGDIPDPTFTLEGGGDGEIKTPSYM